MKQATSRPDIRVKHCAYGHSVTTLLNPRGVTTVSHKYSLTVARHATVVVAVPSTVHYPANYNIKYILFKMTFKSVNKVFILVIYYKLLKYHLAKHIPTTTLNFVNEKISTVGDSSRSKSSYGPLFHSYIWMAYS
jgi:hypothetical protein